jgi:hypothetical protein
LDLAKCSSSGTLDETSLLRAEQAERGSSTPARVAAKHLDRVVSVAVSSGRGTQGLNRGYSTPKNSHNRCGISFFVRKMYTLFGRTVSLAELCIRSENPRRASTPPVSTSKAPSSTAFGAINPFWFGLRTTSSILAPDQPSLEHSNASHLTGDLRRIDRGIYDVPRVNALTGARWLAPIVRKAHRSPRTGTTPEHWEYRRFLPSLIHGWN